MVLVTLLQGAMVTSARDQGKDILPLRASNFSITKAEGRDRDEVQIVYTKKDCFLSGVNTSVTFQYLSGAKPVVEKFWPKWLSGEQKTYSNPEFGFSPIKEVRLSGTAKEHSFRDGKETVTRITFAEHKRFLLDAPPSESPWTTLATAPCGGFTSFLHARPDSAGRSPA